MKWIAGLVLLALIGLTVYYYFPKRALPPDTRVDSLIVWKHERRMEAYSNGKIVKQYFISLGKNPTGDKHYEGDFRTPEGKYIINNKNAKSGFHKNLGISYPDRSDIAEARALGKKPGGEIKIHGLKNGQGFIGKFQRFRDWTEGCIALTDDEIDELYAAVKIGTPITIRP